MRILACFCLAAAFSAAGRGQPADIFVTGLLARTAIDQSGHLRLTLRNQSEKVITAYKLAWPDGAIREQATDLIGSLAPLVNPGRVFRPATSLSLDDPFGPNIRPGTVAVRGVVYDDNSWEGEPGFQSAVFAGRQQRAVAIEKFLLPLLGSGRPEEAAERVRTLRNQEEAMLRLLKGHMYPAHPRD